MFSINAGGVRITGNLNEGIGDAGIGSAAAGQTGLPTVAGAYGQLGANAFLSTQELVSYTNTTKSIATIYGGWFKYVKFASSWSATMAAGQALWYTDKAGLLANTVSADHAATGILAGFCLAPSVTKGNYWWIQTGGIVNVLCKTSSVTSNLAGDYAFITSGTTSTVDALADAGTPSTGLIQKLYIGQTLEALVADAIKLVAVRPLPQFQ
jgi:hypothetical protein